MSKIEAIVAVAIPSIVLASYWMRSYPAKCSPSAVEANIATIKTTSKAKIATSEANKTTSKANKTQYKANEVELKAALNKGKDISGEVMQCRDHVAALGDGTRDACEKMKNEVFDAIKRCNGELRGLMKKHLDVLPGSQNDNGDVALCYEKIKAAHVMMNRLQEFTMKMDMEEQEVKAVRGMPRSRLNGKITKMGLKPVMVKTGKCTSKLDQFRKTSPSNHEIIASKSNLVKGYTFHKGVHTPER